ncbi:histidine phosphatase family protein [Mesonia sp. JHPTF-M18]|uniref:Histidine phosphatase family protein n=2 Tax=Mesonia aestuariivivens TaxID=2796128 RepID=A0ABS6VZY4_9FLAO|nr:histidine phosphatase family protein [Mesonia aestuariivivens]
MATKEAEFNFKPKDTTVYYFIRHGEKDREANTDDPHLLPKGMQRANFWAKVLKDKEIDMVYSTNYQRTLETARPTADQFNIKIELYKANHLYSKNFQKKTDGKHVLIVGHQDTTPQFINKILKEKKYSRIEDNENSKLFIVTIYPNGKKSSTVEQHSLPKNN